MSKKVIHALYDDDHVLLNAAKQLVAKGIRIREVYSPFPIHGIDPVIGVKRTRLAIVSFLFGITGLTLALIGFWYFMIADWPMNIGGKPSFSLIENLPSFIPITFEFTVLCAAHGMVITYLIRNWTLPGVKATNPDPRTTNDKFLMEIHSTDNKKVPSEEILELINQSGVFELSVKETA